jgi:hypothetical protein
VGVFGYVDAIHGPGGQVCAGYQPTRNELLQLARYWAQTRLDIALDQ